MLNESILLQNPKFVLFLIIKSTSYSKEHGHANLKFNTQKIWYLILDPWSLILTLVFQETRHLCRRLGAGDNPNGLEL